MCDDGNGHGNGNGNGIVTVVIQIVVMHMNMVTFASNGDGEVMEWMMGNIVLIDGGGCCLSNTYTVVNCLGSVD